MSDETTRLNIERARDALARARMDQVAAAVRAPRPADLSRLRENEERRSQIDDQAGAFRDAVRARLGLGEYRGPGAPVSSYVGQAMSAPLCDADICAPAPHPALNIGEIASTAAPSEPAVTETAVQPAAVEADGGAPGPQDLAAAAEPAVQESVTESGDPYTPLPEGYVAAETPAPAPAPITKKRRKFLGIF